MFTEALDIVLDRLKDADFPFAKVGEPLVLFGPMFSCRESRRSCQPSAPRLTFGTVFALYLHMGVQVAAISGSGQQHGSVYFKTGACDLSTVFGSVFGPWMRVVRSDQGLGGKPQ